MEYKTPTHPAIFTIDWANWLPTSVTIVSSTHTLDTGLTQDTASNTATTATIEVSGGDAGKVYENINTITDSQGNTYNQYWYLTVQKNIA